VVSATVSDATALVPAGSVRTLILGLDAAGRIVQHDRSAADMLAEPPAHLLGTEFAELITDPGRAETLPGLLAAASSGRDATVVLPVRTARGDHADAVVTIGPVHSSQPGLAAQAIVRIAPPLEERFLDPAVMRHALLDAPISRTGGALDIDQIAPEVVNVVVPHFCNAAGLLVLESLIAEDEVPTGPADGSQLVRRLAVASDDGHPSWAAAFPTGEILHYPQGTPYVRCLASREPVLEATIAAEEASAIARSWHRRPVARLLTGSSMLVLPLIARDILLGLLVCTRKAGYRRFDAYDREIGMEFASRAAIFIDNARRYSRERATALTLQRSLLPTGLTAPSCVEVRHRYLPGGKLIEVGGDWYESIALPGGRVALVVGDVAGHGVRAAVTMGRLRTAIRTLARLELPLAEILAQLDELMHELGVREPHFATCVYAVYDTVAGTCEVASAGHLPPLLARPGKPAEYLDITPAPPLGIGGGPIESKVFHVDDGSVLVLYTDGLVERRGADIDEGLGQLREVFSNGAAAAPLDDLCRSTLAGVYAQEQRDDIAVLVARLRHLAADHHVSWRLRSDLRSVRRARTLVGPALRTWGLDELVPTAQLLVSELVTNAVRYATGKIGLQLVCEGSLFCEVHDDSAALPRLRRISDSDDERGRGLRVVSQLASRWGTRRTATGKVVWAELPLPHG
jgi:serine phosphatase RsbU (regulator of sigma subunit)